MATPSGCSASPRLCHMLVIDIQYGSIVASSYIPYVFLKFKLCILQCYLQAIQHFLSKSVLSRTYPSVVQAQGISGFDQHSSNLQVVHMCQELLSAERCPMLSLALPIYEKLVVHWRALSERYRSCHIYQAWHQQRIMEYVRRIVSRLSHVYALAMSKVHELYST